MAPQQKPILRVALRRVESNGQEFYKKYVIPRSFWLKPVDELVLFIGALVLKVEGDIGNFPPELSASCKVGLNKQQEGSS